MSIPRYFIIARLAAACLIAMGCMAVWSALEPAWTLALAPAVASGFSAEEQNQARNKAQKLLKDGNFKEAWDIFNALALHPDNDPVLVGQDMTTAVSCLLKLNRISEIDAFRERVIETHADNWRLLRAAASNYLFATPHDGFLIAGEFERGPHRGGGKPASAFARDRVRALQLMRQAVPLIKKENLPEETGSFYREMARMLLSGRHGQEESWQLLVLTDLDTLPDYEEGYFRNYGAQTRGAPVDEDGNPIFHKLPASWEAAKTDGERWRWALMEAVEAHPWIRATLDLEFAEFHWRQFGVQTMQEFRWIAARATETDSRDESGTYALHTLGENETIARLATGIKRFSLPDEFNFIRIFRETAQKPTAALGRQIRALKQLGQIFENRRQYDKAADCWRRIMTALGTSTRTEYANAERHLKQIVDNWGEFEPVMAQPAGRGATILYRFRNGKKVEFEAREVHVEKLLQDVKNYIRSRPSRMDYKKVNIANIGFRLVEENETQYIGEKAAEWSLDLEPRPNHFDRRVTVSTPLQKPGAYLLTARMEDGNISRVLIWLEDTAIIKKPMDGKVLYFVADARTGEPVPNANLEFFGYKQEAVQLGDARLNRFQILIQNFSESTNADGIVIPDPKDLQQNYQWIITATNDAGRFAYLGFTGIWYGRRHDEEYNQTKILAITDRPVYRPAQTVQFKMWIRHAKYDQENTSSYAGGTYTVQIHNPKGDKVFEENITADTYSGLNGEYALPADATLGQYGIRISGISHHGRGSFRVEEYKKPEFEVTVEAPNEPVMLGEKIEATVKAKYYFGEPVKQAKVSYKVLRSSHSVAWYPTGRWDWLYGSGYWWFAYDYDWYPGWGKWGCFRPTPWWWHRPSPPPEVVMENEVEIGEDGIVRIEIDTALAKEMHTNTDHRYEITAEVTDQSRRTIVGKGEILVAREPFKVYAWVDRGHYRVGDTILASFNARTPDGKPVEGKGEFHLFRIRYVQETGNESDGGAASWKPVETSVEKQALDTNVEGHAQVQLKASQPGQYRLSYQLTDAKGRAQEGGYVFTIMGASPDQADWSGGSDSSGFRFNDIEIIPDKREYAPGETVQLQINTQRRNATVLLFIRPANGVYLPPKVIRPQGWTAIEEIPVTKKDMPNFFVEAVTISDGRIHTETRSLAVPPETRILNLEVLPSKEEYKPGEKAKVRLKLTDHTGEPFIGSMVLTVYDKAVEYISGGSNVPEIKEFFWKWRRHHNPGAETNLGRWFHNLLKTGEIGMQPIGVFGRTVAEEMDELNAARGMGGSENGWIQWSYGPDSGRTPRSRSEYLGVPTGMAMPQAAAMMMGRVTADADMSMSTLSEAAPLPPEGAVEPTLRTEFADTAFWAASIETNAQGTAEVEFTMPDNLTGWKVKTWAMGHGTKVAEAETIITTKKNLLLRMQAPRFFVEKDEVVLSANVHNYLKDKKKATVYLEIEEPSLFPGEEGQRVLGTVFSKPGEKPEIRGFRLGREIEIEAGGEQRVDWRVRVVKEGEAVIRMKALTDEESDAMEMRFPVYVHGMDKMVAFSGWIKPEAESGKITLDVPAERRQDASRLEVRYSPTLAGAMVDALPYLVDYPYGCVEQTLNRFLPTVITQKILLEMGVDLKEVQTKRTNLNAQELGDAADRAKQWKRYKERPSVYPGVRGNPVFDEEEVARMVKEGLKALTEMQLDDGGWGWFSGWGERSSAHMTATVVHGLQIARTNGVALVPGVLERGIEWLERYQKEEVQKLLNWEKDQGKTRPSKRYADNLDALVYMVLVDADKTGDAIEAMRSYLYRDRNHLAVYGKAVFGIALHKQGRGEQRDMLIRNIEQFLVRDDENQTAYLNLGNSGYWWYWYGSEYEAHAYYLKLLAATGRANDWKAPYLVKYLLNNRKHATYWNSTRDTAICIEAFADYLKATEEHKPDLTVEILVNGKKQKEVRITPKNLFTFDNAFVMEGDAVETGKHTVEIRKIGTGPLYFNAHLSYFSLEDFITKAGLEVKVERQIYKLTAVDKTIQVAGSRGQAVGQKVEKYDRTLLKSEDILRSGDLIEIELIIESKNDYEYLVFEDFKAAGFEPVEVRSGYTGNEMGAYVEFRDNRLAFFVSRLARGRHSISYRTRAEIPGRFSALPARGWAMYAPELRGNSDEIKLRIED